MLRYIGVKLQITDAALLNFCHAAWPSFSDESTHILKWDKKHVFSFLKACE